MCTVHHAARLLTNPHGHPPWKRQTSSTSRQARDGGLVHGAWSMKGSVQSSANMRPGLCMDVTCHTLLSPGPPHTRPHYTKRPYTAPRARHTTHTSTFPSALLSPSHCDPSRGASLQTASPIPSHTGSSNSHAATCKMAGPVERERSGPASHT